MDRLSKENIRFIDNYLRNSDVNFIDIRLEIVDHVASVIENQIDNGDTRSFYSIFKDYMVLNKKELLKTNRKYFRIADIKILKSIFKKSFSIKGLIIFVAIFLGFDLLGIFLEKKQLILVMQYFPMVSVLLGAFTYYVFIRRKKERYSSLERIGVFYMIVAQIINLFFSPFFSPKYELNNLMLLKISTSFFLFIMLLLTLVAFDFKKSYQLKYAKASLYN